MEECWKKTRLRGQICGKMEECWKKRGYEDMKKSGCGHIRGRMEECWKTSFEKAVAVSTFSYELHAMRQAVSGFMRLFL
jgi:hypothetical protein